MVRALDDRFEIHAHRRRTGPSVTEEQTTMAMLTFGAATFVEESHDTSGIPTLPVFPGGDLASDGKNVIWRSQSFSYVDQLGF